MPAIKEEGIWSWQFIDSTFYTLCVTQQINLNMTISLSTSLSSIILFSSSMTALCTKACLKHDESNFKSRIELLHGWNTVTAFVIEYQNTKFPVLILALLI